MWTGVGNSVVFSACIFLFIAAFFAKETLATNGTTQPEDAKNTDIQDIVWQLLSFNYTVIRHALMDTLISSLEASQALGNSAGSAERMLEISAQKSASVNHTCVYHIAVFLAALEEGQVWALQMLDAMGKSLPGSVTGDLLWTGDYDLCNRVVSNTSTSLPGFSGKYCNAVTLKDKESSRIFKFPVPYLRDSYKYFKLGLCLPDTCSQDDVTVIINNMTAVLNVRGRHDKILNFTVQCPPRDLPLDTKAIAAIAVFSVLLLCVVLGTTADVVIGLRSKRHDHGHDDTERLKLLAHKKSAEQTGNETGVGVKALLTFSLFRNFSRLMSTHQAEGSLTCINGIRFISMSWIAIAHTFTRHLEDFTVGTVEYVKEGNPHIFYQTIYNAGVAVDSFFLISGLLVAYLTLKKLEKNDGKFNWFLFYFHRFWRLTPTYMLVIVMYVCLTPYWIAGPLWTDTISDREGCKTQWWKNLLYINNFIDRNEPECMSYTWYLANDMQFYCLSPLVILLMYKVPLLGVVAATLLLVASTTARTVITALYSVPPLPEVKIQIEHPVNFIFDLKNALYVLPVSRIGPYIIGLLAGYFLHIRERRLHVRWYLNVAIWSVMTGSAIAVLYGMYPWLNQRLPVEVDAVYNGIFRSVWATCIAWVIIACVTGNGGFVNTFLSWSAFIPLSRLTYCLYMLFPIIGGVLVAYNLDRPQFSSLQTTINTYFANLVTTVFVSVVFYITMETPLTALETVVLGRGERRQETPPPALQGDEDRQTSRPSPQ